MARSRFTSRRAIALREVIVVTMVLAVMLMLLLMWLGRTTGDSRRNLCEHRMQQTTEAMMKFEATHGYYPGYKNLQAVDSADVRQPTGWVFGLLPFFGDEAAANDPNATRSYGSLLDEYGPAGDDAMRGTVPQRRIIELQCPDDPAIRADATKAATENAISWVLNTGMPDAAEFGEFPADWTANGMFENQFDDGAAIPPRMNSQWLTDHDGLERTLMLSENVDAGTWTDHEEPLVGFTWVAAVVNDQPTAGDLLLRINERRGEGDGGMKFARPSSYHVGGVNVVFASGQTQFMSEDIDWLVFTQLMTSDGANAKLPGSETPLPEIYR